jgi:hypothetical protein
MRGYDSIAFANGKDLVTLHFFKSLDLLGRGPLHFNRIHNLVGAKPKVKP